LPGPGPPGERRCFDLAGSALTPARAGPGKKSQYRPGRPNGVPEIEMVGRGIIEIDGPLNQPQPKRADVEIKRPLRIAGDGRDMMEGERCRRIGVSAYSSLVIGSLISD
jgi:hypothetical protein